jgi:hypothetical protein
MTTRTVHPRLVAPETGTIHRMIHKENLVPGLLVGLHVKDDKGQLWSKHVEYDARKHVEGKKVKL